MYIYKKQIIYDIERGERERERVEYSVCTYSTSINWNIIHNKLVVFFYKQYVRSSIAGSGVQMIRKEMCSWRQLEPICWVVLLLRQGKQMLLFFSFSRDPFFLVTLEILDACVYGMEAWKCVPNLGMLSLSVTSRRHWFGSCCLPSTTIKNTYIRDVRLIR